MKKGTKVKNIHTREDRRIIAVKVVGKDPYTITIYVFDDGARWEETEFYKHWREV